MTITSESRTSGDSRQHDGPAPANFQACAEAINTLGFLMRQRGHTGIANAVESSQVFAHLTRLREALRQRPHREVPMRVLSLLSDCRSQIRSATTPKRRKMRGRLRHIGTALQLLGGAQALLTERRQRFNDVWVLVIVEIEIRVTVQPQQHRKSSGKRKKGRRRRRPYFHQHGSTNGTGQHPS